MHQITKARKLLQPLRTSPRVHIVAAFHYILSFLALAAIALIPLLYLMRAGIHRYLGRARADELRAHAAEG